MRVLSAEEQYAKVHEGCAALAVLYHREREKPEGARDPFLVEGGQGYEALEHLRDLAYFLSENYGVYALYCAGCGGLIEDGNEALEHGGFHAACDAGIDAERGTGEAPDVPERHEGDEGRA